MRYPGYNGLEKMLLLKWAVKFWTCKSNSTSWYGLPWGRFSGEKKARYFFAGGR